jgi:hypothetical protein
MIRNLSLSVIAVLLLGAAGCSGRSSSKAVAAEMATLDQAYRSGVLTKAEYEAKKAGLESQAPALDALEKAVAAGLVSKNDYPAIKARLIAKGTAIAALERAHKTGVFSDQEYAARKAALEATASAPSGASAAAMPAQLLATSVSSSAAGAAAAQAVAAGTAPAPAPTTSQRPAVVRAAPAVSQGTRQEPSRLAESGDPKPKNGFTDNNSASAASAASAADPTATIIVNESGTYSMSSRGVQRIGAGSNNFLPSWVPAYPGATKGTGQITTQNGKKKYEQGLFSPDPIRTVVDFYRTRFTGFKVTNVFFANSKTDASLALEDAKYTVSVSVGHFPTDPLTTFTVQVDEK